MDTKELTAILVVAMVGCVIVAGFIPVVGESVTATTTFENEGYFKMTEITEETDTTIVWDHTDPAIITVDGVEVAINPPLNKPVSIVGTDSIIIRCTHPNSTYYGLQVYCGSGYIASTTGDGTDMTITISGGTVTATNGTLTRTETATQGYYIDPAGKWVMKDSDNPAYIHKNDSVMILAGITNIAGAGDTGVYAEGTIKDGLEFTYVPTSSSTPTVTFGEVTFNYADVTGYVDLVNLNSCVFDITNNGVTNTATYSYFIVPSEVTAEKAIHADDNTASIISMLPFILIMGIVLMFIGVVIVRRYV